VIVATIVGRRAGVCRSRDALALRAAPKPSLAIARSCYSTAMLRVAIMLVAVTTGCVSENRTRHRQAYIVDGVIAGLGALSLGEGLVADRACGSRGCRDHTAVTISLGAVLMFIGGTGAIANLVMAPLEPLGSSTPPPQGWQRPSQTNPPVPPNE
jgi:hypothetical protein